MNTDVFFPHKALAWLARCPRAVVIGAVVLGASVPLWAQVLSKPGSPASKAAAPVPAAQSAPVAGSGPGVHGADSPFAPLPQRADVVPWALLTQLKTTAIKNTIRPVFNLEQQALNQKTQRIQGFMVPLEPGEKQRHFLLTSVPTTCAFCTPGGPESMVEVKAKVPVKYSLDPVIVEGRFLTLPDDPYGLYYRIAEAVPVK
jgi:hypothetical protein